jgi:hypothetical protein
MLTDQNDFKASDLNQKNLSGIPTILRTCKTCSKNKRKTNHPTKFIKFEPLKLLVI